MMRTTRAVAVAVVAAAALVACSGPPEGAVGSDLSGGGSYSLTQTITNTSSTDLVVQEVQVLTGSSDGAYPTQVPAGGPPTTFRAVDTGNGVHLRIFLSGEAGQSLLVESDVPRVDRNWTSSNLSGTQSGLSMGASSISGGDNPTAALTLDPCGQGPCTTTSGAQGPLDAGS